MITEVNLVFTGCIMYALLDAQPYVNVLTEDKQETQLSLTNRATCLEVSQGHQTRYHSIC